MSDVLNPVQIESQIRDVAQRIANGVKVVSDHYAEYKKAERALAAAYARAYLAAEGAVNVKQYIAELATEAEREARDDAECVYRYAERTWRALSAELDAYRSIGASVRAAYSTGGGAS